MEKLHFSIWINAPKKKVWETMLEDETYKEWTAVFNPTGSDSHFEGDWTEGSDIRFIGPEEDGTVSGMISKIKEARPYDFMSIQHLGEIIRGKEKMWTPEEQGDGVFENYTFNEKDGGTELLVDLDTVSEYADMFNGMWPKGLEKLKELCER